MTTDTTITVKVTDLRIGDRFVADGFAHYTVVDEPVWHGGEVYVWVKFRDGGHGHRVWTGKETITVERPS